MREASAKKAAELAADDLPLPADQLAALLLALDIGVVWTGVNSTVNGWC